jgi:hypothetical protein
MSPKEINEDLMLTLGKESPSYTVKDGLLNLRGTGRALEMMSGLRPPTMKLLKL